MRKPDFCICKNKDADQLRGNREADQRLCFRHLDSTIPLLSKSKISSLWLSSVAAQPGLCQTWSETPKTGFLTSRLIILVCLLCNEYFQTKHFQNPSQINGSTLCWSKVWIMTHKIYVSQLQHVYQTKYCNEWIDFRPFKLQIMTLLLLLKLWHNSDQVWHKPGCEPGRKPRRPAFSGRGSYIRMPLERAVKYEPRRGKSCMWGFRPGRT